MKSTWKKHDPNPPGRRVKTDTLRFICLIALLLSLFGCAARQQTASTSPDWELSPEAEQTYDYLKYLQHMHRQEFAQAAQNLETVLHSSPSPQLYKDLASLYWQARQMDKVRKTLKTALDRYPDEKDFALLLAQSYIVAGRMDDAALTLKDYLRQHPDNTAVKTELTTLLVEMDDFAQALDILESIPENERNPQIHLNMGRAAAGLGLNVEAVTYLEQAVEADPQFFQAWVELAYLFETRKDYARAETIYDQILEQGQGGREILGRLVILNLKMNNPDRALDLALREEDQNFQLQAAHEFIDQEFYGHAGVILKKLAQQPEPPDELPFYLALWAWEGQKDAASAIEYLSRISRASPRAPRADLFRMQLLFENGQTDQALELGKKSMQIYPDDPEFPLQTSLLLERTGKYSQALDILRSAEKKWPENTDILFSLGSLKDKMDDRAGCLEYMEKIIRLEPDHAEALNYLGYSLAEDGRDLDRALILIQNALKYDPTNGYYIDSLAWVHYKLGNLQKAWEEIRRAVEHVDGDTIIWNHYLQIAQSIGAEDKVLMAEEQIRELSQDLDPRHSEDTGE